MLADETATSSATAVAAAYRVLREEGLGMLNSDTAPDKGKLALWRRRVSDLIGKTEPGNPNKELLHPRLAAILTKLEDDIHTKHLL